MFLTIAYMESLGLEFVCCRHQLPIHRDPSPTNSVGAARLSTQRKNTQTCVSTLPRLGVQGLFTGDTASELIQELPLCNYLCSMSIVLIYLRGPKLVFVRVSDIRRLF